MIKRNYSPSLFKRAISVKIARLMNMMYKPSEIAEELGVNVDTVKRSYIPNGLPVRKDEAGRLWINGRDFQEWAKGLTVAKNDRNSGRKKLPEDQAYCLKCRKVVEFKVKSIQPSNHYLEFQVGTCPICKGKVYKARKREDRK